MKDRTIIGVRTRRLGMVLRRLREESGLSGGQVGKQVGISASKVSRAETGKRGITRDDLSSMLTVYGANRGLRTALIKLHADAQTPELIDRGELHADLQKWIGFELDAVRIRNYEPLTVPGLLQTFPYARACIANFDSRLSDEEVNDRVAARIARQAMLRKEFPPRLDVVLHEAALRQRVGGGQVMLQQVGYLMEAAARPGITIRVVPANAGAHQGMDGPFVIMDYANLPSIVHLENKVASLYLDAAADIKTYRLAYDGLLAVAYSPERSVELMGKIASGVV